jgi:purine-cytosine permease-like protein
MTSTDETRNDDAEDAYAPPRIRRSTYTPPPQYRDLVGPSDPSLLEDDPATDAAAAPVAHDAVPPAEVVFTEPVVDADETHAAPPADAAWSAPSSAPLDDDGDATGAAHTVYALDYEPVDPVGYDAPATPPWHDQAPPAWSPPAPDATPYEADAYRLPAQAAPADTRDEPLDPPPESAEPYRPWTPDPPAEPSVTWESLFPTAPRPSDEVFAAAADAPSTGDVPTDDVQPRDTTTGDGPIDDAAASLARHAPPAGEPWIPRRRSLPDDELLSVLEAAGRQPGGTLDALDALENEMRLREEEVQEYREWEESMLAVGTPEALAVVAQVRPEFSRIVVPEELTTSQIPVQNGPPVAPGEPQPAARTPEELAPEELTSPPEPPSSDQPEPVTAPVRESAPLSMFAPPPLVQPGTGAPDRDFDALLVAADDRPVTPSATDGAATRGAISVDTSGIATVAAPAAPSPAAAPSSPAPSTTPSPAESGTGVVAVAAVPRPDRAPVFSLELSGLEPTEAEQRAGRASRMFWLWFAANSSVVSVAFGAVVFSLGMSLRQSIVATLAGVALSFIPLGLGTLAGKRSGQPTVVVSRAAFGVAGNIVPAVLALVSRVFWGAVLLWLFAASVATIVGGGSPTGGLVIVFIVVGVMLAVVVAFLGYALLARVQLVASVLAALLIIGFVAATAGRIDVTAALTVSDGPWVLVTTGAILVFSFVGLVWANSSSDLARYQRPGSLGGATMLWATFGTAVPTFILIAYGALLAASDPTLASGLSTRPIETLQSIVPSWYVVPLIASIGVSLLSAVIVTVYSGAFALQGVGLRLERQWATLVVGVLLAVFAGLFSVLSADLTTVFRDLATTLAVPVAAWAGIFAADTMIRNHPFHTPSLLRPGGVYPSVNWINLPALVAITLLGWGLTTAVSGGLAWQGYLFSLVGTPLESDLAASDLGVVVALVLGLLVPIVSGVPAIRRQEAAVARA